VVPLIIHQFREDRIESDFDPTSIKGVEEDTKEGILDELQTFVFSATLSKDLQRNLKKRSRPKGDKTKKKNKPATTLGTFGFYAQKTDSDHPLCR